MSYDVYSDFDIRKHRETFTNYLEVMIAPDGKVYYAIPSHQEYAVKAACEALNVTRQELCDMTPPDYYGDWLVWLLMQSGYVSVWNRFVIAPCLTDAQRATLEELQQNGLYLGKIPKPHVNVYPANCQYYQ